MIDNQREFIISIIDNHEKTFDIKYMISAFTAYNIKEETAKKFDVDGQNKRELCDYLFKSIGSLDVVWNVIFETLTHEQIIDIVGNIYRHTNALNEIIASSEHVDEELLSSLYRL